ncbi:MAG TPA: DUF5666 domain-containing protein [Ktedonobacterales bacterium]|nr:DUF5666 domain-containing protein [Ktedonobacterales bacterium]
MSKHDRLVTHKRITITLVTLLLVGVISLALSACSTNGGLKGRVASVDVVNANFVLTPLQNDASTSSLTVNVSSHTAFRGALHGLFDLKAGMLVSVRGTANAGSSGLVASEVQDEPEANDQEHERAGAAGDIQQEAELQGTVGTVDRGQSSFVLLFSDGTSKIVTVSAQTEFEGTLHGLADLTHGQRVEVKGAPQSDGSFAAASIEREAEDQQDEPNDDQNEVELTGMITSTDAAHTSFILKLADGTTKTIVTNGQTEFDGGFQGFADLRAGLTVEVRGTTASGGSVLASRVHREDTEQHDGSSSSDGLDSSGSSGSGGSGSSSGSGGDDHGGSGGQGGDGGGSGH